MCRMFSLVMDNITDTVSWVMPSGMYRFIINSKTINILDIW